MKVTIEIELPDGQKIPKSEDILRLTNPDWMAEWWHIDDVKMEMDSMDLVLSDDECREVLMLVADHHDAGEGINWCVIDRWIDHVVTHRKEMA